MLTHGRVPIESTALLRTRYIQIFQLFSFFLLSLPTSPRIPRGTRGYFLLSSPYSQFYI